MKGLLGKPVTGGHRPDLQDAAGKGCGDLGEGEVAVFQPPGRGQVEAVARVPGRRRGGASRGRPAAGYIGVGGEPMVDVTSGKPLTVEPNEYAGPFLRVAVDQLPAVRTVLDEHQVFYWLDHSPVGIPGGPLVHYINFGHKGSARIGDIQRLLDARA